MADPQPEFAELVKSWPDRQLVDALRLYASEYDPAQQDIIIAEIEGRKQMAASAGGPGEGGLEGGSPHIPSPDADTSVVKVLLSFVGLVVVVGTVFGLKKAIWKADGGYAIPIIVFLVVFAIFGGGVFGALRRMAGNEPEE